MQLGIDFGTSNTVGAYLDNDGIVHTVRPDGGTAAIPTAVFLADDGTVEVGVRAQNRRGSGPAGFRDDLKSLVGQSGSPIQRQGRSYDTLGLVSSVIRYVADHASRQANHEFERVTLTVPSSHSEHQRQTMIEAARHAGFDDVNVVEEPIAAARSYSHLAPELFREGPVLLFDLGAGTLDVALVEQVGAELVVAASDGEAACGGHAIDNLIYEYLARVDGSGALGALSRASVDGRMSSLQQKQLWEIASHITVVKHRLSDVDEVNELLWAAAGLEYTLNRTQLEDLMQPLLARMIACCERVLVNGDRHWSDVSAVLLVGGPTAMPVVSKTIGGYGSVRQLAPTLHGPIEKARLR